MEEMRRSVATAMLLLMGLGVVLTVLAFAGAGWLLDGVLGVQGYLLADAVTYFRIYALGLFFQFVYNIAAAVLRSLGNSRATLYVLLLSSVCNVVLDLAAVLILHWGVMGVAVATVISQILSAVVSVAYLFRAYPNLRFRKGEFRFHRETAGLILKMGIPSTIQQCVVSFNHMAIQRVVNAFDITAGYTAAMRIETSSAFGSELLFGHVHLHRPEPGRPAAGPGAPGPARYADHEHHFGGDISSLVLLLAPSWWACSAWWATPGRWASLTCTMWRWDSFCSAGTSASTACSRGRGT